MKFVVTFVFIASLLTGCELPDKNKETIMNTAYDENLAKSVNADDYGMKKYVIAFLKAGPNRERSQEEAIALQKAHLDNIARLAEEGKLVVAGPFLDDGELRGIYIFEQFYEHDYYAIELLPILLSLLMGGLYWIDNQKKSSKIKMVSISLIFVLLMLNVWSTRKNMLRRYNEDGKWNAYYDAYVELKPQLRAYGIEYSDKVLVSSDASPNISLYLLDQLGWTRFPYGLDETMVETYIKEGARYVITREEDQVNRPFLLPYLKEEILRHKNLVVYRL